MPKVNLDPRTNIEGRCWGLPPVGMRAPRFAQAGFSGFEPLRVLLPNRVHARRPERAHLYLRQAQVSGQAGTGNGETCPWENTKDDKIEPSADGRIDRLVYELPPEGDDIWVERRRNQDCGIVDCGQQNPDNAKYCSACGGALQPSRSLEGVRWQELL